VRFTTAEVAAAVSGRADGDDAVVAGVATDSRAVAGGELFVPLRADRDGHDFIAAAVAAGAGAYLTDGAHLTDNAGASGAVVPAVVVGDTAAALRSLAAYGRRRLGATVVGVTGSVGKTTTKDLLRAVVAIDRPTHANQRSFNNDIGVPHTILNAADDTEVLVLEIGANAPGEIAQLCGIAAPDVGVVTRVAPAHTGGFGGIDGVARAKAELVAALPADGTAVLNADDDRVAAMAAMTAATTVTFGSAAGVDVATELVRLDPDLRPLVRFDTPWGRFEALVAARGAHQVVNAGAAVAVAGVLGVAAADMAKGLESAEVSAMRMDLRTGRRGLRVLDDSYNANPASVEAALRALAAVPARRRVAVLGKMEELGSSSPEAHRQVGAAAAALGIEVVAVGTADYGVDDVGTVAAAVDRLATLGDGDVVLVKASRRSGLDVLAAELCRETGDRPTEGSR